VRNSKQSPRARNHGERKSAATPCSEQKKDIQNGLKCRKRKCVALREKAGCLIFCHAECSRYAWRVYSKEERGSPYRENPPMLVEKRTHQSRVAPARWRMDLTLVLYVLPPACSLRPDYGHAIRHVAVEAIRPSTMAAVAPAPRPSTTAACSCGSRSPSRARAPPCRLR